MYIKPQNYNAICDFALHNAINEIQGAKLHALYTLIQKKGEPIKSDNKQLNGVMCLEIRDNEYIALIHKPINKNKFFPCTLKTVLLQKL